MFGIKRKKTKDIPVISPECIGCGICVAKCRRDVFSMSENTTEGFIRVSNPENCTGCGKCAQRCPENAIRMINLLTIQ